MVTTYYDNSGYLTKMGDKDTHDGTAGQPVDDIDFPHSGLIKLFDSQRYGYPVLNANVTTGTTSSIANVNFNIGMDDSTTSGVTTVAVKAGAVIRNGLLLPVAARNLTEVETGTPNVIQFKELGTSGQNFYSVIVATNASPNVIEIRNSATANKVADLLAHDIPIAILRIQNGETKSNRHIQFLGCDRRYGSLSLYHTSSNVPTEAMTITSSNATTTFTNKIADADIRFMLADSTGSEKFEIYEDDGDTELFSVNGLGTAEVKGTLIANSLNVGSNSELTITESSDDIIFTNTVSDKDIKFIVNDASGNDSNPAILTCQTAASSGIADDRLVLKGIEEVLIIALSDETTNLTTGTGKVVMHMPFAMTLTGVKASVSTAPQGANIIVDINETGATSTIMNTHASNYKLTIVANEVTSTTATGTNVATITDTVLADNAPIFFDIDQIGSSTAGTGLKVTLYGYRT